MSDGFLSRWSRRKQEVREAEERDAMPARTPLESAPEEVAASSPPMMAGEAGPEMTEPATPVVDAGDAPLTEEEIAALPPIESITAETDIRVFLRKGVPDFLRKAALRRSWVLDPMIRDYVDPAREYAYDWNVPGSVPGSGALLPSDDVDRLLRDVFPDHDSRGAPLAQGSADVTDPAAAAATRPCDTDVATPKAPPVEQIGSVRVSQSSSAEQQEGLGGQHLTTEQVGYPESERTAGKASKTAENELEEGIHRRRHGGAMPV